MSRNLTERQLLTVLENLLNTSIVQEATVSMLSSSPKTASCVYSTGYQAALRDVATWLGLDIDDFHRQQRQQKTR